MFIADEVACGFGRTGKVFASEHFDAERCRKNGLLVTTSSAAITMFPPLTLDQRTAKQGLDILASALS